MISHETTLDAVPQVPPQTHPEPAAAPSAVQRVAIILSCLDHGGKERVAANLAAGLHRQGLKPLVICFQEGGLLVHQLKEIGVEVHVIASQRGYDVAAMLRLIRLLRRWQPQVLHVHDLQSLAYVCVANRFAGMKPIILTGHGLLFNFRPQLRQRLLARQVRLLTAVSPAAVEEYRQLLQFAEEVRLIRNGVPAERPPIAQRQEKRAAVRTALAIGDDQLLILSVGNLKPEKGYEDLLAAAEKLQNGPLAGRLQFRIVGEMPGDAYQQRLMSQYEAAALQKSVRFLGPRYDVEDLYLAADIFVLSSRKEALPMVVLEAMAAELPVVATSVGALPQVLENGRYALLSAPAAPEELANRIAALADDPRERHRLATLGRQRLVSSYSTEVMVSHYVAAYGAAIEAAAKPRRRIPYVLMLGPMAPLSGGMATVMEGMGSGVISRSCRLKLLQSGKRTAENRSLLTAILSQCTLALQTAWLAVTHRHCVIHIHTCSDFSFWRDSLLGLIGRLLMKPVILHVHGGRFKEFLGSLSPWRARLARWLLRRPTRILVLTPSWRQHLGSLCPGARLSVMNNGVDMPAEPLADQCEVPPDDPDRTGALQLLFLGHLGPLKGAGTLIEAIGLLADELPQVRAVIAGGEKEPGQRARLQQRIDELGLTDRVILAGSLGGQAREQAFAEADAMVLPSFAEGLPMAILEAMSRGLPVIASRVGGIPETIDEGETGLLIDPQDIPGLAAAIRKLALDPVLRRRMSSAASRKARLHYSLEAVGAQLVGLYDSLIQKGRR